MIMVQAFGWLENEYNGDGALLVHDHNNLDFGMPMAPRNYYNEQQIHNP